MPGILPMKVIKIGSNAQSRVAQACDRCRSKKIRCDGVTPCCSQCANVGFECKTSDKLSRRAFPRGYTESLEERVRTLESEVRELKDLLDSKDEKIDMLSRIHSSSPSDKRPSSTFSNGTNATSRTSSAGPHICKEEAPSSQNSFSPEDEPISIMSSSAASTGKPFVDSFKGKLKSSHSQVSGFKTQAFFDSSSHDIPAPMQKRVSPVPSRMASDQMVNLFFQEWSPLFPILHRPTTLQLYATYVAEPESMQSSHDIATLYLVFGIAAISAKWNKQDSRFFESTWQVALETVVKDVSVSSLQCLLLAELYCIAKGDYERLRKYKSMAAKLSRRLGLHQSQKRSSLGPLITESRKRLFWTLFTLDCFAAALLGQPRCLTDIEIACEFPQDVDDENITEEAFLTPPPGESTRLSSALALFQGARIMSEILDTIYPSAPARHISLHTVAMLSERLNSWLGELAPHLHLRFLQDKPSTNVVGSRSPLLALFYHYNLTLLHRQLILAQSSNLGSASLVSLGQSSKHIVQIIQLLEERRMSFSFCLNKTQLLIMAGFGLLYQTLSLNRGCKLLQDTQRYLFVITSILDRESVPEGEDFKKIVAVTLTKPSVAGKVLSGTGAADKDNASQAMPAPKSTLRSPRKLQSSRRHHSHSLSMTSPEIKQESADSRRLTESCLPAPQFTAFPTYEGPSQMNMFASGAFVAPDRPHSFPVASNRSANEHYNLPNLDYLDFSNEPATVEDQPAEGMDDHLGDTSTNLQQSVMDATTSSDIFSYISGLTPTSKPFDLSSDLWTMPTDVPGLQPHSALSISDESLTSGEELSSCGTSSHFPQAAFHSESDLTALDGFGSNVRL